MAKEEPPFPEIKKELIEKIDRIEAYVTKMHKKIYGDDEINPPVKGYEYRLEKLEAVEMDRLKSKDYMLKIAVGSVTFAVGGVVVWVFQAVKDAFIKGH